MSPGAAIAADVSLRPHTTLKAGGAAQWFARARDVDELAHLALGAQREGAPFFVLGWGSNVLPSDRGVPGLVIWNTARTAEFAADGTAVVDCGCGFQDLFLMAAQRGLGGLEFAVGIPGTLGGALVSNAGAYRSNVSRLVEGLEVAQAGERRWMEPAWMEFAYRDSILRRPDPPACALLRVRMRFAPREPKAIYDEAREYQRQRISKQPAPASAGSFFKNVNDPELAERLPNLPDSLVAAGVVPAGYLIEHAGLAGARHGGAQFSRRHANFIVNVGAATASEIRSLAELAKRVVFERYGVLLEEEVLYLGDWSGWKSEV